MCRVDLRVPNSLYLSLVLEGAEMVQVEQICIIYVVPYMVLHQFDALLLHARQCQVHRSLGLTEGLDVILLGTPLGKGSDSGGRGVHIILLSNNQLCISVVVCQRARRLHWSFVSPKAQSDHIMCSSHVAYRGPIACTAVAMSTFRSWPPASCQRPLIRLGISMFPAIVARSGLGKAGMVDCATLTIIVCSVVG
jgi:hypothetical protein